MKSFRRAGEPSSGARWGDFRKTKACAYSRKATNKRAAQHIRAPALSEPRNGFLSGCEGDLDGGNGWARAEGGDAIDRARNRRGDICAQTDLRRLGVRRRPDGVRYRVVATWDGEQDRPAPLNCDVEHSRGELRLCVQSAPAPRIEECFAGARCTDWRS
jgi:hypothetical protein